MPTAAISSSSSSTISSSSQNNALAGFRDANFMKIILTEVTNQDPMNPSDTSKMVESMQQLQSLANTNYEKFRADVTWGQGLVGQMISVGQMGITEAQAKSYRDAGLNVDIGYNNINGRVESFKVINQSVWTTVNGKDYPVDNIKQVHSDTYNTQALTDTAQRLLGTTVKYTSSATGGSSTGVVTSVGYDDAGKIALGIDNKGYIKYDALLAITADKTKP